MFATYVVVTVAAAAANGYAASVDLRRVDWVMANMARNGVPPSWAFPLGAAKALGAAGLVVGVAVPLIGVAAAVGLVLFFLGAVLTVLRAGWYAHLPEPATFLLLAAASLALRLATA